MEPIVTEVIVLLPRLSLQTAVWLPADLTYSRLASWAGYYRKGVGFSWRERKASGVPRALVESSICVCNLSIFHVAHIALLELSVAPHCTESPYKGLKALHELTPFAL